jgi:hypothetical protein
VLSRLARQVKRQRNVVSGAMVLAILIGFLYMGYRRYAFALIWHCVHGNQAEVGGHKVILPLLWWKESAHAHDTYDMRDRDEWLARACPSSLFSNPEINVSPVMPGEEVAGTEEEELKLTQRVISSLNQNPTKGWSYSLVVLSTARFSFYCMREQAALGGSDLFNGLRCHATSLKYSFNYTGPPERENEVQEIFLSLQ